MYVDKRQLITDRVSFMNFYLGVGGGDYVCNVALLANFLAIRIKTSDFI